MADATDDLAAGRAALAHLRHRPRFTPGALFYQVYHRPRGWLGRVRAAGVGHAVRGASARGSLHHLVRNGQVKASSHAAAAAALPLDLLTGRQFYAESVLVALSFTRWSRQPIHLCFHDDGTLGPAEVAALRRWFPHATILQRTEIETRLAARLPVARFPMLHALREVYVPMKKLTDLAAIHDGWRLYVDSDVLFLRAPEEFLGHLTARRPCHLVDAVASYGAPAEFLSELAGCAVHPQVNTGLYFRNVDTIDWEFVELAARRQLARFGFSYFIEQALGAMLFARERAVPLGPDYVVLPAVEECEQPTRVVHHYVNQTRWAFYVNAWRERKNLGAS